MSHDSWSGHPKNRKKPRKFGTVKRANHSVCFITAQLLAGANEKWPCIHLYQISLFSVKQSEIWERDYTLSSHVKILTVDMAT